MHRILAVCAVGVMVASAVIAVAQPGHKVVQRTRPGQWSQTTIEAAATVENKAALADGRMASVNSSRSSTDCSGGASIVCMSSLLRISASTTCRGLERAHHA